jgi:hypothetical protein
MKSIRIVGLGILLTLGTVACSHKKENTVTPATTNNGSGNNNNNNGNNGTNSADTALCFQRDILPIFISNCAKSGCHDAATKQKGYQFTDYNSIVRKDFVPGNADETELYEKITEDNPSKRMPKAPNPPLSSEQIGLIRRWINEGAKNTTGCSTPCDTAKYTYSGGVKPIISKYCQGCHNTATQSGGLILENYDVLRVVATNGRLLGAIKRLPGYSPMPKGGNKLSECEITIIEKWINAGTLNN